MLQFDFCRITELDDKTKRVIYRRMTWACGTMRDWIKCGSPNAHLCLLRNRYLITWVSLYRMPDGAVDVGAWTTLRHRRRGYVRTALWALIDHHRKKLKITKSTNFVVHSSKMRRVVRGLGHSCC